MILICCNFFILYQPSLCYFIDIDLMKYVTRHGTYLLYHPSLCYLIWFNEIYDFRQKMTFIFLSYTKVSLFTWFITQDNFESNAPDVMRLHHFTCRMQNSMREAPQREGYPLPHPPHARFLLARWRASTLPLTLRHQLIPGANIYPHPVISSSLEPWIKAIYVEYGFLQPNW